MIYPIDSNTKAKDRRPKAVAKYVHLVAVLIVLAAAPGLSIAATLPAGFSETQISGLSQPTAMDIAPDGRVFVCLQGGELRVIKNGALLPTPFLSVGVDSSGERGLLGVAFDPNFAANKFVYIYYTVPSVPRHNRVSRFTANGDVAAAGSEQIILELDSLSAATNHNGGAIHFGPDGKLYVAVGENATSSNSQTFSNLLGKMLRINPDGSIPSDNPFFTSTTGKNRAIWALGLRNPFTFTFQPGTSRMFINDVGQNTWEEINDGIAGSNYGWPNTEGSTNDPNFRSPLFVYGHGNGPTTGCAIAGGAFYNPPTIQFPSSLVGKYFFADLCSGWIRVLDPSNNTAFGFATGINQPVDLKVAADGSLYYLAIGSASLFMVRFNTNPPPPIIFTEQGSDIAEALDSVTMMRDPFPLTTTLNLSSDNRTRLQIFGQNLELLPGENLSAITVRAENAQMTLFPLTVEHLRAVPGFPFSQLIVRLPDNLPTGQSLLVSVTLRGQTSNTARIRMR